MITAINPNSAIKVHKPPTKVLWSEVFPNDNLAEGI